MGDFCARRRRSAIERCHSSGFSAARSRRVALFAASALLALTPAVASETTTYSYDARGRLVKVARSGTVNNGASACYTYDNADNRSNVKASTSADCSTAGGIGVSFSISSNGPVTEGGNSVFTITKAGTASTSLTVNYATANGTAVAGSDYTATSGTLTFTTAQTSQTVSVPTIDDTVVESPETFTMTLSAPSGGATIGTGTATATINDNDVANQPPVANSDSASTTACGTVTVNVVANDTDPDGDYPLHIVGIGYTSRGTVDSYTSTSITFTAATSSGTGEVVYTVADSRGATSDGDLLITISGGSCQ